MILIWGLGREVRIGCKVLSLQDCKIGLPFEVREDDQKQWELDMRLLSYLLTWRGQQGTSVACHQLKLRTRAQFEISLPINSKFNIIFKEHGSSTSRKHKKQMKSTTL